MPSTLAAYTVVGEREQGTLEPLLTTPIRQQEFIVGKAAAVMIPTMALSYVVFGLFLAAVALFAHPVVASAVFHQGPVLLALFLLAPLLAGLGHRGRYGHFRPGERGPRGPAAGDAGQLPAGRS
jgi:ABC-type Na+ efflux pump permease subunit